MEERKKAKMKEVFGAVVFCPSIQRHKSFGATSVTKSGSVQGLLTIWYV